MQNLYNNENINLLKKFLFEGLTQSLQQKKSWTIEDFDLLFSTYINALLKTEFELFIKHNDDAIKNGYAYKTIKTTHGTIEVKIPRDRKSDFESTILTTYSNCTKELADAILKLYQLGLSTADVSDFINEIYGVTYSKQSISEMTKVTDELVTQFKQRQLDSRYVAIFLDATYIPVKFHNSFEKQAIHLVVAINKSGYQEIIAYSLGFKETNCLWSEVLDDIRSRGVNNVDIFVSDGFVGLESVIKARYPNSRIQRCTVHLLRNIMAKVTQSDTTAIVAEFKELFKMTDRVTFDTQLKYLKNKYSKYESVINSTFDNEYVTTYLDFPLHMHRTIKTTNRIEAVNQKIKTRIKIKQNFPNVEAMERMLVSSIIMQNNKSARTVEGMKDYIQ